MSAGERLQPTELFPEMATLDCGTCNFGDEVFENTLPMMRDFGKRMLENRIKPEYECKIHKVHKFFTNYLTACSEKAIISALDMCR